jgi:hypothetical protein
MAFSSYNPHDCRLLRAEFSYALGIVRKASGGNLTEFEMSDYCGRIVANLTKAFALDKDPSALRRAALLGVVLSPPEPSKWFQPQSLTTH